MQSLRIMLLTMLESSQGSLADKAFLKKSSMRQNSLRWRINLKMAKMNKAGTKKRNMIPMLIKNKRRLLSKISVT